jgi:uncharacterized protein
LSKQQHDIFNTRERFIASANKGKILANRCLKCEHVMLETIYYCEKCHNDKFDVIEFEGIGKVVTYTIQTVAPQGFENSGSYAWVIFKIDNAPFRTSGFLKGIISPKDLPIGAKVKVSGFDPKRGLLLEKLL